MTTEEKIALIEERIEQETRQANVKFLQGRSTCFARQDQVVKWREILKDIKRLASIDRGGKEI